MPTFQKCGPEITELANSILCEHESHKPLLDTRVKVDYVWAYADKDDDGLKLNNALTKNGCRAYAIARKMPLKDRAMGRGDCEVAIDADYWGEISEDAQKALLDHELHHFAVKVDKRGIVRDDLNRPVIKLRLHDYEFGWFRIVAERNGDASVERKQAQAMFDEAGQSFWPELAKR